MADPKHIYRAVGVAQKGHLDEFCPCGMYESMKKQGLITDYYFTEKDGEFLITIDMKVYAPPQPIHYVSMSCEIPEKLL